MRGRGPEWLSFLRVKHFSFSAMLVHHPSFFQLTKNPFLASTFSDSSSSDTLISDPYVKESDWSPSSPKHPASAPSSSWVSASERLRTPQFQSIIWSEQTGAGCIAMQNKTSNKKEHRTKREADIKRCYTKRTGQNKHFPFSTRLL